MPKSRSRDGKPIGRLNRATPAIYIIDPARSMIGFSFRNAAFSDIYGSFDSFEGLLKLDTADPHRSEAYMSVQTGSLDTGNRQTDEHLKGPGFFDSAKFPLMTFHSIGFDDTENAASRLTGDLRIRDTELPITIDLKSTGTGQKATGEERVEFEGRAALKPLDWGLVWNRRLHAGAVPKSSEISLVIDLSAIRAFQASPS